MAENQEAIAQEFLEALGPDHVALPNSKEYDALKWYNSANYEAKPICLVTPSSASEVSTAIKLIKQKGERTRRKKLHPRRRTKRPPIADPLFNLRLFASH